MVLQHIIHTYVDDDSHLFVSKMYLRKNRLIISIKNTSINQISRRDALPAQLPLPAQRQYYHGQHQNARSLPET